jgi:hypothetical protein
MNIFLRKYVFLCVLFLVFLFLLKTYSISIYNHTKHIRKKFAADALPTILAMWQRNQFLIIALSVAANSAAATSDVVHQWCQQHWQVASGRLPQDSSKSLRQQQASAVAAASSCSFCAAACRIVSSDSSNSCSVGLRR